MEVLQCVVVVSVVVVAVVGVCALSVGVVVLAGEWVVGRSSSVNGSK